MDESQQKIKCNGKWITVEEYKKLEGLITNESILKEVEVALNYFNGQGVKPTLRTLFYYLYSKAFIPNTEASYSKLSSLLVKARKSGRFAWDILEDKTRKTIGYVDDKELNYGFPDSLKRSYDKKIRDLNIDEIINSYIEAPSYTNWNFGKWANQPIIPEIWIEKEALAGTIASWVSGIKIRVCRGYTSWTFLYNIIQDIKNTLAGVGFDRSSHKSVVIYYLGDLDPSGKDIERHIKSALKYFKVENVEFKRLAITPEQVIKHNLPPRPKDAETLEKLKRDPRSKNYEGRFIIELDALVAYAPQEFKKLIKESIQSCLDVSISTKLHKESAKIQNDAIKLMYVKREEAKKKLLEQLTSLTSKSQSKVEDNSEDIFGE